MAVGLMMLPALAARYWTRSLIGALVTASGIALLSGYCGLLVSFHADLPSGPAIVLFAGAAYLLSLVAGRQGLVRLRSAGHTSELQSLMRVPFAVFCLKHNTEHHTLTR